LFTISVIVTDLAGNEAQAQLTRTVGSWGLQTVQVSGYRTYDMKDSSMRFNNFVVQSNGKLQLESGEGPDEWRTQFQVNNITVENGGTLILKHDNSDMQVRLMVRGTLDIQQGATLIIKSQTFVGPLEINPAGKISYGGSNGGDSSLALDHQLNAYGNFRQPLFAGIGGVYHDNNDYVTTRSYGGGATQIIAQTVKLNGSIQLNGDDYLDSPDTVKTRQKGLNFLGAGAGGSLHLVTETLSGYGSIDANGGSVSNELHGAGAGGRIAIEYGQYYANVLTPELGLSLSAAAGLAPIKANRGGAGTIYLRGANDVFGRLIVDAGPQIVGSSASQRTTLPGVGQHFITAVSRVADDVNQYRITVAGSPWFAPEHGDEGTKRAAGIAGLQVRLNAADSDSAVMTIADNGTNYLIVNSTTAPAIVGEQLTGVIMLDNLSTTLGVNLVSIDPVFAHQVSAAEPSSVEQLDLLSVLSSAQVGALTLIDQNNTYLGGIIADSLTLDSSELSVTGDVQVNGDLTITGSALNVLAVSGNMQVAGDLIISGENVSLNIAGLLTVTGEVLVDGAAVLLNNDGGLSATGPIRLINSSVLTTPAIRSLHLTTAGLFTIDASSQINLDGKGYPADMSGFNGSQGSNEGCHGGRSPGRYYDCTYGRYDKAAYPGSGGETPYRNYSYN
ncbi:MAG: hypothetical protein MJK04_16020, partial [Psychrosphaera sp.]|nr:hypothetical protein [Psychrosphaera sp.]